MYLSNVAVHNFRLFDDFSVTLQPGLTLVVGENNSGKTALVDAIRFALTSNSGEWLAVRERDFRSGQTSFEISLRFDDIEPRQARAFVEHLTHEKVGEVRRSVLYVNFSAQLTDEVSRTGRVIRTEVRSGKHGDGPQIEREVREYLSATYLRPLRDAEAELSGGRGSRLAQILNSSSPFASAATVEALLQIVLEANAGIIGNDGVSSARAKIEAQLREIDFSTNPLSPTISIVGGTSLDGMSDSAKRQMLRSVLERLQLLIDETDRNQGLGYSNLLFMATELLLLKQELDDFPLLLVEEPEAHLHPQLQMKFLKALASSGGAIGSETLQSVLTTHSPNLASKVPLSSVIIMDRGRAFPLGKGLTNLGDDDYVFLEKFLDVTKANLFFAKGLALVEGDGEAILLPTIAELLGAPLEDHGISIINVGSRAYARFARIFQRKGLDEADASQWLGTRVVCLTDRDLRPEQAKISDPADTNPHGFIEWKEKNKHTWESHYTTPEVTDAWKKRRLANAGQNVRVEISDNWTLEYDLILAGLWREVGEALELTSDEFAALPTDPAQRAVSLYRRIAETSGAKTETAYRLGEILRRKFGPRRTTAPAGETAEQKQTRLADDEAASHARRTALRGVLPAYIVRSLDYLTSQNQTGAATAAVAA